MTEQYQQQPQPQTAPQPAPQPQTAPQPAIQPQTAPQPAIQPQTAPQPQNAYDSIIAQQQAQIEALINANNNLTQQVTQMVQNGAQFYQQQPAPQQMNVLPNFGVMQPLQNNEDYSLEALAKEIGKRDDLPPKRQ